jgi:SAM-dependent methyltransferase
VSAARSPRAAHVPEVVWHDVECGAYAEDLPLWRDLAIACGGPVLDVGAGTGRVALHLAGRGHAVVALDRSPTLLAALRERADGLPIETVEADARSFDLGERRFGLILVPMQTVQLLGGSDGRAAFLRCAAAALAPRGLVAIAIADALEAFDEAHDIPPVPDIREIDGIVYASRPVAVRDERDGATIHRVRETVDTAGNRTVEDDVIHLDHVDAPGLEAEGAAAGLRPRRARRIPQTDDYVGSTVVMLRG